MALPKRIPKKRNRSLRWRSPAHCNFVRSHECSILGCQGRPIEVAHVRRGSDAGMGRKPSDWHTVSLCQEHHAEQHRVGEESFEARYRVNLSRIADEFAGASPKALEIKLEKSVRAEDA